MNLYLIGSLRNPHVPNVASYLRSRGHEVFDDWYAAGPNADDAWRDYEKNRGRSFLEGLRGLAARHVYDFDREHLYKADAAVLLAPAGKSAHLELGWCLGRGKPGYVVLQPGVERWDVMYQLATGVYETAGDLADALDLKEVAHWDIPF